MFIVEHVLYLGILAAKHRVIEEGSLKSQSPFQPLSAHPLAGNPGPVAPTIPSTFSITDLPSSPLLSFPLLFSTHFFLLSRSLKSGDCIPRSASTAQSRCHAQSRCYAPRLLTQSPSHYPPYPAGVSGDPRGLWCAEQPPDFSHLRRLSQVASH